VTPDGDTVRLVDDHCANRQLRLELLPQCVLQAFKRDVEQV